MRFLSRLYFCSAPRPPPKPLQTSARIPPASAPAAPLLYPFQPGAALAPPWPLSLQQALLSLLTPLAPASALHFRPGPALPPRPCTPAPALHSRLGPPLPPRPCTLASALRSRLGPPLPPWPSAPALALRSRLGPPLPPRPPTPAPAIHPRFTCTFLPKCSTWNIWGAFLSLENSERSFAFVGMKFNLQGKNVPRGTFFPCKQALELLPENHYIL